MTARLKLVLLTYMLVAVSCGARERRTATPEPAGARAEPETPAAASESMATFQNPILAGFHPDPSIVRVGDDFYLVNSSFEYFPGLPIHHSRDLVHWELIGNALDRPSQIPLKEATDTGGLYAPTIRYHQGKFYITCTNFNGRGAFVITADTAAGPWSEPLWLNDWQMDASLFFDDDGKVYYTKHAGGERAGISQAVIDLETGKFTTPFEVIYNNEDEPWNEGPHLYKENGYYYLTLAEGGTGAAHQQVILRSKSPWGPFEACPHNPILTHRGLPEEPIQALGHADFVQAPDASWWMVVLGVRPETGYTLLGRETFLAPVVWNEDAWPVVNENGRLSLELPAPKLTPHPFKPRANHQDFSQKKLGPEWIYPRNPDPENFSLQASGKLRIRAASSSLSNKHASPAFVGQRQSSFRQRVRTLMEFAPERDGQEAGLCIRSNDLNHYEVGVERHEGAKRLFVRNTVKGITSTVASQPYPGGPVFLEIAVDAGVYAFSWSTDGSEWSRLGASPSADLSKDRAGGFTGTVFGLYASSNGKPATAFADFDWWQLSPGEALAQGPFSPRPEPPAPPPASSWRIHVGGEGYTDSSGQVWAKDIGFVNGNSAHVDRPIAATQDAALYQFERWEKDFSYALPVPPGRYRVKLRFAENFVERPGERIFNVSINDRVVLERFDIFKAAGGPHKAIDRVFNGIEPNEQGLIRLRFYAEVQNAKVGAIEVTPQ